ncbi:rhodanese-like domain-containing protein [Thiomicrospira sp. R3]|uniref:rhodanese-like domain-containing protein n=1 Tax=Thiomicrospira sp. R3 TaxID=3035472 RepID=UPI00259BBB72|nr:rhodanese-like domain-containing protein [Thiomicrospira sp. R3]WFE68429.1 rhodanese-like domain-containing protein [Thiomicrospira sp. R3]
MFIPCEQAKALIKDHQGQLVDVRTPQEFMMEPIPGSINIPLHEIDQVAAQKLNKSLPVVVFCRSGQRSYMAQQILMGQGFASVHNLGPSMAWYQCPDI